MNMFKAPVCARKLRAAIAMLSCGAFVAAGLTVVGTQSASAEEVVTQKVTASVKFLPKGATGKGSLVDMTWQLGDDSQKALKFNDQGEADAAGTDTSDVVVTLTGKDGKTYVSGTKTTWRRGNPRASQNFGLIDFAAGTYQVAITEGVDHWAIIKNTDAFESNLKLPIFWKSTLDVTGNTPNKFVLLGYDSDNDGVADVEDTTCASTPAGAQADGEGCALDPRISDFTRVTGTVGEPIDPVTVPIENPGLATALSCKATGLPEGLSIALNAEKTACVISGTSNKATDGDVDIKVIVEGTNPDKAADANPVKVEKPGKANISPLDADKDGVADDSDLCAGTPAGAQVDEHGCALAPEIPSVPDVTGEVGAPVTVEVPVANPGLATGLVCSATGLPEGLTINLNDAGTACVISGIPTEVADGPFTVKVDFTKPDGDKSAGEPVSKEGKLAVVPEPDEDADGVPDSQDDCAGTPAGATVDEHGCALAPSVPKVPAINGEVNKPIKPIVIPIDNPGKATDLVCSATGLPKGLTIKVNKEGTACVISGTPASATAQDQPVDVKVSFKRPDGDMSVGEVVAHAKVTIVAAKTSQGLAKTGVATTGAVLAAFGLLGAGLFLLLVRRRRVS